MITVIPERKLSDCLVLYVLIGVRKRSWLPGCHIGSVWQKSVFLETIRQSMEPGSRAKTLRKALESYECLAASSTEREIYIQYGWGRRDRGQHPCEASIENDLVRSGVIPLWRIRCFDLDSRPTVFRETSTTNGFILTPVTYDEVNLPATSLPQWRKPDPFHCVLLGTSPCPPGQPYGRNRHVPHR